MLCGSFFWIRLATALYAQSDYPKLIETSLPAVPGTELKPSHNGLGFRLNPDDTFITTFQRQRENRGIFFQLGCSRSQDQHSADAAFVRCSE